MSEVEARLDIAAGVRRRFGEGSPSQDRLIMGVSPVEFTVSLQEESGPGSENRTRFLGRGLLGVFVIIDAGAGSDLGRADRAAAAAPTQ